MPVYRYECHECGRKVDAFRHVNQRDDAPVCHQKAMTRRIMPTMVAPAFNTYRAVAEDKESGERPVIRSRDEHRAFLRRNGYEEVGDDPAFLPKETPRKSGDEAEFIWTDADPAAVA